MLSCILSLPLYFAWPAIEVIRKQLQDIHRMPRKFYLENDEKLMDGLTKPTQHREPPTSNIKEA